MKLVKIEPKEFGLEVEKGTEIANSFLPIASEIEGLNSTYNELITSEITEELCVKAKAFYTLLKKTNGSNDKVHKAQKAYFLAGGKFADALKNKNKASIDVMKEKTLEIVNHYEKIEEERIIKLHETRLKEITSFLHPDAQQPIDLGHMQDEIWGNYLLGAKASHEARAKTAEEAETARLEAERLAEEERKAAEAEQERIRKENERLKIEADKKEAERLAELKAIQEKERVARLQRESLAKIEADKQAKIQAELKAKADAEKAEFERKLKIANDAKLKAERETAEKERVARLQRESLAKIEADKQEAERLAALAPEKEKIQRWIDSIELPDFDYTDITIEGKAVLNVINAKFEGFKKWAEIQKESIK